jgi:hypothetical protein
MGHNYQEASVPGSAEQQRMSVSDMVTAGLLLGSLVIAVLQPAWLTVPLRNLVEGAGAAAPVVFVLLCAITASLHLNGVLVPLSTLLWPLPIAGLLSFTGSLIGCILSAALLQRLSGESLGRWANRSALLRRLSAQVAQQPWLIGFFARVAIGSGIALEAFYLLTGYTRRQYLVVTVIGVGVWVMQSLVGVTVLQSLSQLSPWLAVAVSIVAPLLGGAIMLLLRKGRQQWSR